MKNTKYEILVTKSFPMMTFIVTVRTFIFLIQNRLIHFVMKTSSCWSSRSVMLHVRV